MTDGAVRDEIEIELALEPLGDDLEMQEAEEAAAEAEAQRRRAFRLEREAGVVEAQTRHGIAQILEVRRIDREQAAEHHRLRRLEARQRLRRRVLLVRHRVADARIGHFLDRGGEEADLARAQLRQHLLLGPEDADALHLIVAAGGSSSAPSGRA